MTLKMPFCLSRYTGKPWVLVSGGSCGKVIYLVPESDDPLKWAYQKYLVLEDSEPITGIEVIDIDEDGFSDIFVSLAVSGVIKVFSLSKSVSGKPDIFVAANTTLQEAAVPGKGVSESKATPTVPPDSRASSGLFINCMASIVSLSYTSFPLHSFR